jgi:hypothetical protein
MVVVRAPSCVVYLYSTGGNPLLFWRLLPPPNLLLERHEFCRSVSGRCLLRASSAALRGSSPGAARTSPAASLFAGTP